MDKIRQDILHEQEVRKSKLAAHFGQSFSPNGTVNEDGRDIETTATKSANEVHQETQRQSVIKAVEIDGVDNALDILKGAGTEDLFEKAKHQDGDMHPNGKWVWVASAAGGKGDWRTLGGRVHKKSGAAGGAPKQLTANGGSITKVINKITSASKNTKNPEDMSLDELNAELTEINNNISNTKKLIDKLEKEGKDGQASRRKLYVKTKYEERKYIQEYIDKLKSSDSDTSVK